MIKLITLFILASANADASMFDVPLRSISLKSEIALKTETLEQISVPGRISIQSGKRVPEFEVNDNLPRCSILSHDSFTDILTEFVTFKIISIHGVALGESSNKIYFRTKISLQTEKLSSIQLECVRPLNSSSAIEELSLSDFSEILGDHIKLRSVRLIPGSFEPRNTLAMSKDLILNHLKIELSNDLTLNPNVDDVKELGAKIGKCNFFQFGAGDGKSVSYPKNSIFIPKTIEILYRRDAIINARPHVIMRFDESLNFGVSCDGSSLDRMFDYQDFWDATGKNGLINWIIIN